MTFPRITKTLWTWITNATHLASPASTDRIPVAPQPGTNMVTDIKYATLAEIISGGGGVTGPGSSTDKAIARWNGTTGQILENSVPTIDNLGQIVDILSDPGGAFSTQVAALLKAAVSSASNGNDITAIVLHAENTGAGVVSRIIGAQIQLTRTAGTISDIIGIIIENAGPGSGGDRVVGLQINDLSAYGTGDPTNSYAIHTLGSLQSKFGGNVDVASISGAGTPGFDGTVTPVTSITVKKGVVTAVS